MRTFVIEMTDTITIKIIQWKLPLYLSLVPFFSLLMKLATSSSSFEMSLLLLFDFASCFPFCLKFLYSLNVVSFVTGFFCSVLI
jgi:hypothetical protein